MTDNKMVATMSHANTSIVSQRLPLVLKEVHSQLFIAVNTQCQLIKCHQNFIQQLTRIDKFFIELKCLCIKISKTTKRTLTKVRLHQVNHCLTAMQCITNTFQRQHTTQWQKNHKIILTCYKNRFATLAKCTSTLQ